MVNYMIYSYIKENWTSLKLAFKTNFDFNLIGYFNNANYSNISYNCNFKEKSYENSDKGIFV